MELNNPLRRQLNNPLRTSAYAALETQEAAAPAMPAIEKTAEAVVKAAAASEKAPSPREKAQAKSEAPIAPAASAKAVEKGSITPQIPMTVELAEDPELRKAMELLASRGLEVAGPKKVYVKHTYEIEKELHDEFHAMYSVLGFKNVKTAINDALRAWCKKNHDEYLRRQG